MTAHSEPLIDFSLPRWWPNNLETRWRQRLENTLDQILAAAPILPVDDSSKLIIFSDAHRGDGGPTDAFQGNADLFLRVLERYFQHGHTYIELGDGDELWKVRAFSLIQQVYSRVFELLQEFQNLGRLHMLVGNHDLPAGSRQRQPKPGFHLLEGLILRHRESGRQAFLTHGHQADLLSDWIQWIARMFVRYFYQIPLRLGLRSPYTQHAHLRTWGRVEARLTAWAQQKAQMIVCGHTHFPLLPEPHMAPYSNTGSCIFPGYLTGLEIESGEVRLVRWAQGAGGTPERQLLSAPQPLRMWMR
jgi:UDP-2,3-diacylglucosamine pyrophosphatase LpxH